MMACLLCLHRAIIVTLKFQTFAFEWLFSQRRDTEMARGKLAQLTNPWLGRDAGGQLLEDSGTAGMNSAQFTTGGASDVFVEGWTPESVGSN